MNCPRCGADIAGQKVCEKCGMPGDADRKDIEVKYKDFKTSELLEIRHKKHSAPPLEETKTVGARTDISQQSEKRPFPILAVVLIILALISGAFFIVRHLIQP